MRRAALALSIMLWTVAVGGGATALTRYAHRPGAPAAGPARWPAATSLPRGDGPTLIVVVHPLCPCSHATVAELARLMADARGALTADVVVVRLPGVPETNGVGDLAADARAIPGVRVIDDPDGVEARRFGARTSGQALLYGGDGILRFSGGITAARGHEGDNAGRDRVATLARGEPAPGEHPVFGCSLFSQCATEGVDAR